MTDTTTLSPCPFCGERAETDFIPEHHSYQIECRDVFGCTARVTRDSEQAAIEAWNCRAPSSAAGEAQPVAVPAGVEPCAYMFQNDDTGQVQFVDAQQVEWGFEKNNPRLIKVGPVYTAAQVQAMLAAVPRNAPLYSPDDVAFPVQRSADGADALPPELTSIARPASIAAVEVAAPSAPGE